MQDAEPSPLIAPWTRAETVYAVALFAVALSVLGVALVQRGAILPGHGADAALFFVCYGLFTISIGYQHPTFGYYSFDRVAQVASILVLGPIDAAWINGLASLIYPWHRAWRSVPLRNVASASLNNSGLMTLIILASGSLYTALGGEYPLTSIGVRSAVLLVVLVLSMQALNDLGMLGLLRVGHRDVAGFFNAFSYAIELGSGATAVLVALIYNTMPTAAFVLLLAVLSLGMLALQRFAAMRHKLEAIVEERTRSLREKTRELEEQVIRDNLTKLFNRRYADDLLAEQVERTKRHAQSFTIALADIDFFKRINDTHSHATGDAVLRRVAEILAERCRKTDVVARYGGEEFLLCFPHTDLRHARLLCEQLRSAVEDDPWAETGVAAGVTISFGIAEYRGESSADAFVSSADRQLYAAKHAGRNRVVA